MKYRDFHLIVSLIVVIVLATISRDANAVVGMQSYPPVPVDEFALNVFAINAKIPPNGCCDNKFKGKYLEFRLDRKTIHRYQNYYELTGHKVAVRDDYLVFDISKYREKKLISQKENKIIAYFFIAIFGLYLLSALINKIHSRGNK